MVDGIAYKFHSCLAAMKRGRKKAVEVRRTSMSWWREERSSTTSTVTAKMPLAPPYRLSTRTKKISTHSSSKNRVC